MCLLFQEHKWHRQSQAVGVVQVCVGEVDVAICFEQGGMSAATSGSCAAETSTDPAASGTRAPARGAFGADR